jgi:hypothetical protein
MNSEAQRLREAHERQTPWKKWGPYLSERQWGTVREDYSFTGASWDYFPHDHARSRAYRWGEDGLAGISDDRQYLCFALALWNGADPILKERLFGLTNNEGNHGEDCKEYYFYLDNTPTHAYMKFLYKYPQAAYPYADLLRTNGARNPYQPEYELIDTGVFDADRYFDVFVEYAKESPEDILIRIRVWNRGPEAASLTVLPTLWFRDIWSWEPGADRPTLRQRDGRNGRPFVAASHPIAGDRYLFCDRDVSLLFTSNETNTERLFGIPNATPYVKDSINDCIVHGRRDAVNPDKVGTKVSACYPLEAPPGGVQTLRLRLRDTLPATAEAEESLFGPEFDAVFETRLREADAFYAESTPAEVSEDGRNVMRQAMAGMLWTKQFYLYPVKDWMEGDPNAVPPHPARPAARNAEWFHLYSADIISMPDKWEYPWFAAWDLAFHAIALARIDPDFAKEQLLLMTQNHYIHPNGQLPAYEWSFGHVNPPVHASAAWQVYLLDKAVAGRADYPFLESIFHKLMLNFTWWLNRTDQRGNNVFEGGFLGLDNIGVFDRGATLPTGGFIEQADGTSWMAVYCQDMLTIALELAQRNPVYQEMASKFYQHFLYIASAINHIGPHSDGLWDEEDGFFYDLLRLPDGSTRRMKTRSMVGLLPLAAAAILTPQMLEAMPDFRKSVRVFNGRHPELLASINDPTVPGQEGRYLLSLLNRDRLRRLLARMLDETEFLSDYGLRALSRYHREHPYIFQVGDAVYRADYEPADSTTGHFGNNSNWRGPIWMPMNLLLLLGLVKLYAYYGDDFKVECPTGSGNRMTLHEVALEIRRRLIRIFLADEQGRRAVYGGTTRFQTDPHWRDLILFYEYFHGDNGAGIGASHQTGWTGLISTLLRYQEDASAQARPYLLDYVRLMTGFAGATGAAEAEAARTPAPSEARTG